MVAKSSTEPKLRFSKEYRVMIAQRATELANLSLGGMVFVQFAPDAEGRTKLAAVVLGFVVFWVLHIFAYLVMQERGDDDDRLTAH